MRTKRLVFKRDGHRKVNVQSAIKPISACLNVLLIMIWEAKPAKSTSKRLIFPRKLL